MKNNGGKIGAIKHFLLLALQGYIFYQYYSSWNASLLYSAIGVTCIQLLTLLADFVYYKKFLNAGMDKNFYNLEINEHKKEISRQKEIITILDSKITEVKNMNINVEYEKKAIIQKFENSINRISTGYISIFKKIVSSYSPDLDQRMNYTKLLQAAQSVVNEVNDEIYLEELMKLVSSLDEKIKDKSAIIKEISVETPIEEEVYEKTKDKVELKGK